MKKEDDYISREVADMYLPEKVKNLGIFCLVCTPFAIAGAVLLSQAWIFFALCALFLLVTGICALLCYKICYAQKRSFAIVHFWGVATS